MSERLFATMAVSVSCSSSSQNFEDGVRYALSQLGLSDLQLKNEQKLAIHAIFGGKDVLTSFVCQLASAKVSAFRYFLSSSTTSVVWLVVRREVVLSSCLHSSL